MPPAANFISCCNETFVSASPDGHSVAGVAIKALSHELAARRRVGGEREAVRANGRLVYEATAHNSGAQLAAAARTRAEGSSRIYKCNGPLLMTLSPSRPADTSDWRWQKLLPPASSAVVQQKHGVWVTAEGPFTGW